MVYTKHSPLTEQQLIDFTEQPIAVMIPAWNESEIIYHMIENTLRTLNYTNYYVFIGAYPNDPATQREAYRLQERFDNIHLIVVPNDGPTNKADCLNWIYRGILSFEKEKNIEFQIFVMDDAEDIIHPLTLKLFNYLIPRKDMVQLPVIPFEPLKWYNLTVGHYLDEFAENHCKNLVIREVLNRGLPSAGVGCAFSRKALETAAKHQNNYVFGITSLTEDYEMGMRLRQFNIHNQVFVKFPVLIQTTKKQLFKKKLIKTKEYIAIRERFPDNLLASVKQKSRWIVGVALQGWESLGWRGDLLTKLILFRDRKSLITSQINILSYIVIFFSLGYWLAVELFPEAYNFPMLVEEGTIWWNIILVDTFFMINRLCQRMYYVYVTYNFKRSLLSLPGFFWGNIINFLATNRAIYLFIKYLITGKWIAWDHTKHTVPSEEELKSFRKKLGQLILEKQFITAKELEEALKEQKRTKEQKLLNRPLGEILLKKGFIKENELLQVLSIQLCVSTIEIDPYQTPLEVLRVLPRHLAVKYSIYPIELKNNRLIVAINKMLTKEIIMELEHETQRPIELHLTTKSDLSFAIQKGYERLQVEETQKRVPLG